MTDADALLAAILRDPADDIVRLAYADELERDAPARAEFIRTQIELARLLRPSEKLAATVKGFVPREAVLALATNNPAIAALRKRERELLAPPSHHDEWCKPCPRKEGFGITFTRGFVGSITATLADLFGGPCPECQGGGSRWYADHGGGTFPCRTCKGDPAYRTPGCAAELFAAQPVERVTITGAEPYQNGYGFAWFDADRNRPSSDTPETAELPAGLFAVLAALGEEVAYFVDGRFKAYPTRDEAMRALPSACVQYGRSLAGLPPLRRPAALARS